MITPIVGLSLLRSRPSGRVRRRGIDPGLLKLTLWPARIYFLVFGKSIVENAYRQVSVTVKLSK